MKFAIRSIQIILLLFLSTNGLCQTITIATIDWCPFICPNSKERPGLLVEYTKAIFERQGYQIEFKSYPWTRTIKMTKNGTVDAALAPAKSEAPDLIYPESNIGVQRFCFFKRKDDPWKYENPESITDKAIVYPQDALPDVLLSVKQKALRIHARAYNEKYMLGTTKQVLGF
jgi:ABC-type amino acid transport substrate-binding protein